MADLTTALPEFKDIVTPKTPLASLTRLGVGGPAELLATPRDAGELGRLIRRCKEKSIPLRVLGGGCNLLVRDEGVQGVVVRLSAPAFTKIAAEGSKLRAGAGASLADLIAHAVRTGLAGIEPLVGLPGTVGGAIRHNASDRSVEIGHFVRRLDVIDAAGSPQTRTPDELRFSYGVGHTDDPVLVTAEFELERDQPEAIARRLRKSWIQRQGMQPFLFQAATRVFKNPAGLSASALLEQAGLVGAKVGAVQVSERDANYIVAEQGAHARDVLRLIELMRSKVEERFNLELELEISIW